MKFDFRKKTNIGSTIALTMSLLVAASTLGIAIYSIFFLNTNFSNISGLDLITFQSSLQRLVIAFLVLGMIASYYLTKFLMKPLSDLVEGTKELSKGNLEYRFRESNYEEISKLVITYNHMAENLQALYSDLEKKVKERTIELENANNELKNTQVLMVHSEKMRSLGELVAGITHEINNPVNFIHGNLVHLKNYTNALFELIDAYQEVESDISEEKKLMLDEIKKKIEIDFIREDLPMLIASCQEGSERTKNIILDLKNFSRVDEMVINEINLPKEIDTTLNILHNKIKNKVEIVKEYEDDIPLVEGYGGQLNQVFMNILDNASYAVGENDGKIFIRLYKKEKNVIIEIEDTGCGMSKEQAEKIFDPFFTTKPVGSGTGLGLSISYKVVQRHNGNISVSSEPGKGTKFTIVLPIELKRS